MNTALPAMAASEFELGENETSYKLVYTFQKGEKEAALNFRNKIAEIIEDLNSSHEVSLDVYNEQQEFVVVHGFTSAERAQGLAELLETNNKYRIDKKSFYISTPNYRIAQIHKNIDTYLTILNNSQ